jgi:hypothetical protein
MPSSAPPPHAPSFARSLAATLLGMLTLIAGSIVACAGGEAASTPPPPGAATMATMPGARPSDVPAVANGSRTVPTREALAVVEAPAARIRDLRQGPDGWLYMVNDDGALVRLEH